MFSTRMNSSAKETGWNQRQNNFEQYASTETFNCRFKYRTKLNSVDSDICYKINSQNGKITISALR